MSEQMDEEKMSNSVTFKSVTRLVEFIFSQIEEDGSNFNERMQEVLSSLSKRNLRDKTDLELQCVLGMLEEEVE